MLLRFWQAVANKVAPFKRWLIAGALLGSVAIALFFTMAFHVGVLEHGAFVLIVPIAIGTFWCVGLLTSLRQFGRLPPEPNRWQRATAWYFAIFSTVWFALLTLGTMAIVLMFLYRALS